MPPLHERAPVHTDNHLDCPACERARQVRRAVITGETLFSEAARIWIEARSYVAPGAARAEKLRATTRASYQAHIDSLNLFFANLPLGKIHDGHLSEYQEARVTGAHPFIRKRRPNKNEPVAPCPCSPKKVNQELGLLKTIMRGGDCWTAELQKHYEPFREDASEVPRALELSEQHHWLETASTERRWWVVYWYCLLAFGTSMGTNEMRSLRIGDVSLTHEIVSVPPEGAKNHYRARTIPLASADTQWAAQQLLARAWDLGSRDPRHYLFPLCLGRAKGKVDVWDYDPSRPMTSSGLKKPWTEVRAASGLKWFTPYDTRHTALTRWAESGMSMGELMALAGHVTVRMMRHYMHISDGVKRRALAAVSQKIGPKPDRSIPFYIPSKSA